MNPYQPLQVTETYSKLNGRQWWVKDPDGSFWLLVEPVGSRPARLTCWCDHGQAYAESPSTEPECVHLRAVIDQRMADQKSSRPSPPLNISALVD